VGNPVQAEIIKNALAGEGIRCFIEDENQAAVSGLIGVQIRLLVPERDAERAVRFIQDHEQRTRRHRPRAPHEGEEGPEPPDTGIEPHNG
jgi:hypothetical protein